MFNMQAGIIVLFMNKIYIQNFQTKEKSTTTTTTTTAAATTKLSMNINYMTPPDDWLTNWIAGYERTDGFKQQQQQQMKYTINMGGGDAHGMDQVEV